MIPVCAEFREVCGLLISRRTFRLHAPVTVKKFPSTGAHAWEYRFLINAKSATALTSAVSGALVGKDNDMPTLSFSAATRERRQQSSRNALLTRVVGEFQEMPCLRLTAGQAQRLFDLRSDVCQRVLSTLISEGTLTCDSEQRYRLSDARILPGAFAAPAH